MAQNDIANAFAHTQRLTQTHYENFPVASWLIPRALRQDVCNIYAFARSADDFADEARFAGERMERLNEWEAKLQRCLTGGIDDPIFVALAETIRTHELPLQLFLDLLTAFKMDVTKSRYATFDEVLLYCRHSANPVGRLVLHLFGLATEERCRWSDSICTGLQLANFWQDVAVDLQKDRIYLPQDELANFGVSEADFTAHRLTDPLRKLIAFQVDRTERLFQEGKPLLATIPHRRLRLELACTWHSGLTILRKIRQNEFNSFLRPVISARDKVAILWKTFAGISKIR